MLGERSGKIAKGAYYVDPDLGFFDSSWIGVLPGTEFAAWRVVAWTGEGPKNEVHTYAQFNSDHPGLTMFGFCDGSTHSIADSIDWDVFRSLGTISGGEVVGEF